MGVLPHLCGKTPEKLIIVFDVVSSISYTLHLAVPTRFKSFDIVSQGGADLKDCLEFNIFLNSYVLFYDGEILKKHGKEIKMFTYCLPVKLTSTLKRLLFF